MNYYFSGLGISNHELNSRLAAVCPYRLLSCHGSYLSFAHKWTELAGKHSTILYDSGAFTAWSKGHEVNLEDLMKTYSDLLERHGDRVGDIWMISLDRIPGSPGKTASEAELHEAILESDRNFNILVKEFGPRILPVFHQNESLARLHEVSKMSDYICVSPRNDLPERSRVKWSSEVHTWLAGKNKTHGLATTGKKMLTTVPWYSADSSSWIFAGGVGRITVLLNGKLVPVSMSSQSPDLKYEGEHFLNMPEIYQQQVEARILECGFTLDEAMNRHDNRMAINMLETIKWMDELTVEDVDQRGIFDL